MNTRQSAIRGARNSSLALAAAAGVLLAACGPVYYEDRWYARGYYSHGDGRGYEQAAYQAGPGAVAPDPQFVDLTPYGQWVMTPEYGRVWMPYANRTPGWRPYFYGQWTYTDWGWSWVSDEAWGAGPYHYGRWTWMSGHQWVWIPDYTWGPSWVVWSHGGGCVGWAPLGPGGATYVDIHAHYTYWTYVPTAQFGGAKVQHVVVAAADVPRIHQQTVVVDNTSQIRTNTGGVVTYSAGPQRDQVQQWTARPVEPRPIAQVPSAQPRRIPADASPPAGGSYGSATAPNPARGGAAVAAVPSPATAAPPTRPGTPGAGVPGTPTAPHPDLPNPSVPRGDNPSPPMPARTGVPTATAAEPPSRTATPEPGRPSLGAPYAPEPPTRPAGVTPSAPEPGRGQGVPAEPPSRQGTPFPEPPSRQGTPATEPPSRPGVGYTGPAPASTAALPTVPRPTPPPVDRGMNYAPIPSRYVPPSQAAIPQAGRAGAPQGGDAPAFSPQPSRGAAPGYTSPGYSPPSYAPPMRQTAPSAAIPTPSYQPSRPAAPSYSPPAYSPPPSYQPSRPAAPSYAPPAYAPPAAQRFSPPPAYAPAPSRPAPAMPAPPPQRRR